MKENYNTSESEIHLGLRKGYNGYHVDLIDKDGKTHEDYYDKVLNCEEREEAEKKARELFKNNKVIFDY